MVGFKKPRTAKGLNSRQQPTPPTHDELSDAPSDFHGADPTEKDATELELEKLLFGDETGFREGLKSYRDDTENIGTLQSEDRDKDAFPEEEEADLEALNDNDLFFIDTGPSITTKHPLLIATKHGEHSTSEPEDPPAWVDSDDERLTISLASNPRLRKLRHSEAEDLVNGREYTKRLRQQFERLYPVPEWANPSASKQKLTRKKKRRRNSNGDSGSEDSASTSEDDRSNNTDSLSAQPLAELLRSTNPLTTSPISNGTGRPKLRPEKIDMQRLKDIGNTQPSAITSLSFHPHFPLILSSGPASLITLFHLSPPPTQHSILTTLHIPHNPLYTSTFHPTTPRIFFASRRRYFHIWNLHSGAVQKASRMNGHGDEQRSMEHFKLSPCGRWMGLVGTTKKGGTVNVLNAGTLQWVCQVRVEGPGAADLSWWGDGEGLTLLGKGGEAVEYCMAERRVVDRWIDDGGVGITCVAMGGKRSGVGVGEVGLGPDRWIAVGSESGIVNVYDRSTWKRGEMVQRPGPVRTLMQLVTPTSHLLFSPDGQMMVMGSQWKRDALRLVHLPSCTVYKNWPTANTPLGRITAVAMSANSEMLAVGNEQGKIRLWEIRS